jgi:hypothetical protein
VQSASAYQHQTGSQMQISRGHPFCSFIGLHFTAIPLTKVAYFFYKMHCHKQLQITTLKVITVTPISNTLWKYRHGNRQAYAILSLQNKEVS